MYPGSDLDEELLDTKAIAIPPLPSRGSIELPDRDKEIQAPSMISFDNKSQSSRPLKPAVDNAYKTGNDCFFVDTLNPSLSIFDIANIGSDPLFSSSVDLSTSQPTVLRDDNETDTASGSSQVLKTQTVPPRRRFNYALEEKQFMKEYYDLFCKQNIPPKAIARRIYNKAKVRFPYFSHSEKQVRIFVYNTKQARAKKRKDEKT